MPEIFATLLLLPSLGGAMLLTEWLSRTASGREERVRWRTGLYVMGMMVLALTPAICYFAAQRFVAFDWKQAVLLTGRLLLVVAMLAAGVSAIRVARAGEPDERTTRLSAIYSRDVDRLKLSAGVLALFPLLWFVFTGIIFVAPIAYLVAVVVTVGRGRETRLLWLLAVSVENDLSLPEELDAFSEGRRWREAYRLQHLASRLRDGAGLAEALESQPGVLPPSTVSAIRAAERTGTLAAQLRSEATRQMNGLQRTHLDGPLAALAFYYWLLMMFLLLVLSGLGKWIVPKYREIFEGFETPLPAMTRVVMAAADWIESYVLLAIPLLAAPAALLMLLSYVYLVGWPNFNLPLLMRWFPRRDAPGVLRSLAAATAAGAALPKLLENMAEHHRRPDLAERLERIGRSVSAGDDAWNCLVAEGLLTRREAAVVVSASRAGHLPYALNALADSIERAQRHRKLWWIEIAKPLVVLSIGLLVAVYAVGMFVPLIALLSAIS